MTHRIGQVLVAISFHGVILYPRNREGQRPERHTAPGRMNNDPVNRSTIQGPLAISKDSAIVHSMMNQYIIEFGYYPIDGTTWTLFRLSEPAVGMAGIATVVARFHSKDQAEAYLATLQS